MPELKKIQNAVISLFHKDGINEILDILYQEGVCLYSTGGTKVFIESLGFSCYSVEDLTGYPSILGGRVKTLHPIIFGGILNRRNNIDDQKQLQQYKIPCIDLVIVDLYPFQEALLSKDPEHQLMEKIDIGGISLIRAAAKNYKDVVVIASQNQYKAFQKILMKQGANSSIEDRRRFAMEAFAVSSEYDTAIFNYFDSNKLTYFRKSENGTKVLRYGENEHQRGSFYGSLSTVFDKLQGKEISYNNLLDISAALDLIIEFDELTFAIFKHNNTCGVSSRSTVMEAWHSAVEGDPISAFGGVFICNREIDKKTAITINKIFFEIIIAPSYEEEALKIFQQHSNRIVLLQKKYLKSSIQFRSLLGGVLVQDIDNSVQQNVDLKLVTAQSNTKEIKKEIKEDLLFANKIVKHNKSNAIVLVKNKQLLAGGVGQTSRVDALKQAIMKADSFNFDLKGAIMASDAFFPFPDCVEIAHKAGVVAVVQPGGSVNDKLSIEYCNKNNIIMFTTGVRHFKH